MSIAHGYRGTDVIMREYQQRNGITEELLFTTENNFNELFQKLKNGGKIVSSASCTELEIAQAKACGRIYVDEQGYGFIYLPENK
jgi:hypothetical protein